MDSGDRRAHHQARKNERAQSIRCRYDEGEVNSRSCSVGDIEVVMLVHEERRKAHVHCNQTSPSFDDNRRRVGSPV